MYRSKTTFVIGAGASLELGFPTGAQLKGKIREALDLSFDRMSSCFVQGDLAIAEAMRKISDFRKDKASAELFNDYLRAGWHIRDAIQQAISIDNFVDNLENEKISTMAKLTIASCIIDSEKDSRLLYKNDQNLDAIDWNKIENSYLHFLFQSLTESTKISQIDNIFKNTSFIIFNYDRVIEFFFVNAINNYFKIPIERCQEIVSQCNFYHPYGQIGKLPWQDSERPSLDFGAGKKSNLFEISQQILTFTEQIEDEEQISAIRETINNADQIVFLGFAFHDANMELLTPERDRDTHRIVATAYQISDSDCDVVKKQFHDLRLRKGMPRFNNDNIILDNSCTCSDLFQRYGRTLRS